MNDFDEVTIGLWEWDSRRLGASVNVAVGEWSARRERAARCQRAVEGYARQYQTLESGIMEIWYLHAYPGG